MNPFIAEVVIFGCTFAPRGWAQCNGQLLPIAQNTALFSLIGTTFGGDGRTTTALPNFQGRMMMGSGRGPGLTTRNLGQQTGTEDVMLTTAQMPSHNHTFYSANTASGGLEPAGHSLPDGSFYSDDTNEGNTLETSALSNAGGGQAHYNMSPFLSMNVCIALEGVYPSRS